MKKQNIVTDHLGNVYPSVGAMNIWMLGTLWVSGIENPSFAAIAAPAESATV